jgi:CheY-like chemotaxis protein/two-component sensor histidine kinase
MGRVTEHSISIFDGHGPASLWYTGADVRRAESSAPETLSEALHDISNDLTAIAAWLDQARALVPPGHPGSEALVRAALRVSASLGLAREVLGADPAPPEPPGPVVRIVEQVVADLGAEATRAGVTLHLVAHATNATAEPRPLRSALTNLLLNALAFAPRDSTVRVTLRDEEHPHGTQTEIHVEDDGPGIPEPARATVFDGASKRVGGAGHGLAHARRLSEQLGGSLSLLPSPRGAHFAIQLPLTEMREPLVGSRVLVVEDDAELSQLIALTLSARGAHVDVTASGDEGLRLAGAHPYHWVVVDASPFGGELGPAIEALREGGSQAQVMVITGNPAAEPVALPADVAHLRKPFELRDLVARLGPRSPDRHRASP